MGGIEDGGGTPPHSMDEYQKKGDGKWAIRKCMKRKSRKYFGGRAEVEGAGYQGPPTPCFL
jgi:hypothetical protein